ncbi:TGBp1 [Camellia ringspot associated virus 4]|uniref:TGBp1 n=1 Tax=Camellia ringspot associated virus 4 TaxID=2791164 RepID=A0A7S9TQY0_9VIRU|nr:TGBp1 [Camellia ringspot associated virus 4]QPI34839.1 TGBp1 [Camellia ringspot associated virus 4]
MEILFDKLVCAGFERTKERIRDHIIVHCVAGAGKSTLIREIVTEFPHIEAYTLGVPDLINLSGSRIKGISEYSEGKEQNRAIILDEYLERSVPFKCIGYFADPNQYEAKPERAHFICSTSLRFGSNTAELISSLGFPCKSVKQDIIKFESIFRHNFESEDVIVTFEPEIEKLLTDHKVEFKSYCEIRGSTFDSVCFITLGERFTEKDKYKAYICLTRHRKSLTILTPDASYTPC